jgi:tRNA modification GTPase
MDTAGLRKAADFIEEEGVRRTKERVAESDFILLMLDGSQELDGDDAGIFVQIEGKKKVVIVNKYDLPLKISLEEVARQFPGDPIVLISCLRREGVDDLRKGIYTALIHQDVKTSPDHLVVANIRHKRALVRARDDLSEAVRGLEEGASFELIAFEIRSALEALGEIVGETVTEEVLDQIFERFCIGK